LLVTLRPPGNTKIEIEIKKDIVCAIAQAGVEAGGDAQRIEGAEGAVDAARRGQDGILLRYIIA